MGWSEGAGRALLTEHVGRKGVGLGWMEIRFRSRSFDCEASKSGKGKRYLYE